MLAQHSSMASPEFVIQHSILEQAIDLLARQQRQNMLIPAHPIRDRRASTLHASGSHFCGRASMAEEIGPRIQPGIRAHRLP